MLHTVLQDMFDILLYPSVPGFRIRLYICHYYL